MVVNKNSQCAVECQAKVSKNCSETGKFFDGEEEAVDWVEGECWINSGDGWICNECHDHFMGNLKKHRKVQGHGIDGLDNDSEGLDGLDNDLEKGIDIVR